MSYFELMWSHM